MAPPPRQTYSRHFQFFVSDDAVVVAMLLKTFPQLSACPLSGLAKPLAQRANALVQIENLEKAATTAAARRGDCTNIGRTGVWQFVVAQQKKTPHSHCV